MIVTQELLTSSVPTGHPNQNYSETIHASLLPPSPSPRPPCKSQLSALHMQPSLTATDIPQHLADTVAGRYSGTLGLPDLS